MLQHETPGTLWNQVVAGGVVVGAFLGPRAQSPTMATTDSGMRPANQMIKRFVRMASRTMRYSGHFVQLPPLPDGGIGGNMGPGKPIIGCGMYPGYVFMLSSLHLEHKMKTDQVTCSHKEHLCWRNT